MSFSTAINPITQQMIASIVQSLYVPPVVMPQTEPELTLGKPSGPAKRGRPSHYLQGKKWCKGCRISFESLTIKCPSCGRFARSKPHNKENYNINRKVFEGY